MANSSTTAGQLPTPAAATPRRRRRRWPWLLLGCVALLLAVVPVQPLRFWPLPDGLVIYSVGLDGVDNGGNLDPDNPFASGIDLGFSRVGRGRATASTPAAARDRGRS